MHCVSSLKLSVGKSQLKSHLGRTQLWQTLFFYHPPPHTHTHTHTLSSSSSSSSKPHNKLISKKGRRGQRRQGNMNYDPPLWKQLGAHTHTHTHAHTHIQTERAILEEKERQKQTNRKKRKKFDSGTGGASWTQTCAGKVRSKWSAASWARTRADRCCPTMRWGFFLLLLFIVVVTERRRRGLRWLN